MHSSLKTIGLFFSLLFCCTLYSFNAVTDSLENNLIGMPDNPSKIDALLYVSQAFYTGEKCMKYAEEALQLAKRIGTEEQIGLAYGHVAWAHSAYSRIDDATTYVDSALNILERIQSYKGLAWTYNFKALLFMNYEQFALAEQYFTKALAASEHTGDIESQARVLNRWGVMYIRKKDGPSAFEKHQQTLSLVRPLKNDILIGQSLHNLGVSALLSAEYPTALDYLIDSYQLRMKIKYYNGVAETMAKIAEVYFEVLSQQGNVDYYADKIKELGFHSPFELLEGILKLPGSNANVYVTILALDMQIKGYATIENFKKAYEIQNQVQAIKDSITFSPDNMDAMADQKIRSEKDFLDVQNKMNQLLIEETKRFNTFLGIGALLIFLVSIVIYRSRNQIKILHQDLSKKNELIQKNNADKEALLEIEKKYAQAEVEKWKELNNYKNTLFGNITHEFRTPLTVILGITELLKEGTKVNWKNGLETITRNGHAVLNLVNQMLDLTKLQSGNIQPNFVQGDVMAFVNYLVESYQSFALSNNKNLTVYVEPDEFIIDYDAEGMQNIVSNLISNSLKFTPEYGKVQAIFKGYANEFKIEISDNGIGIPEKDLPFIFNRFFQSDATEKSENIGSGIGLSIVKSLVDIYNGEINVQSNPDQGTKFTITIPVNRVGSDIPLSSNEKNKNLISNHPDNIFKSYKPGVIKGLDSMAFPANLPLQSSSNLPLLLLIEDNRDVINYLESCLRSDYTLQIARNGSEGIERALESIPDIIISDVMMPGKNGYEVCERLKSEPQTSHIPIILLTAKASHDDLMKGLSIGADAYLTKPFNREELLVRIEKLVELRRTLQRAYKEGKISDKIENEFLDKLNHSISENLEDEDFDVMRLCKKMSMSRTQLHRKITALTGFSTSQYIRSMRLTQAMKLLKTTNLNISEIAYQVGFKHPNNFSTAFRVQFGVLPNETRK